jgi:hypothetical protein
MPACLEFREVLEVNAPTISELKALGERYAEQSAGAGEAGRIFAKQVRILEGNLRHTYALVARATRKAESLPEIAEAWQMMREHCDVILKTIQDLRERFPGSGTAELYDLALDYKLACDERCREVEQEIACQPVDFPAGIFPKLS